MYSRNLNHVCMDHRFVQVWTGGILQNFQLKNAYACKIHRIISDYFLFTITELSSYSYGYSISSDKFQLNNKYYNDQK